MEIVKGNKYVCVRDLIVPCAEMSWCYKAGRIYESVCDGVVMGDISAPSSFQEPMSIRELNDSELDCFILYDRTNVPPLCKDGVYICISACAKFKQGDICVLVGEKSMKRGSYCVDINEEAAEKSFYQISSTYPGCHDKPYAGFNYIYLGSKGDIMRGEKLYCREDGELKRANGEVVPKSEYYGFFYRFKIDHTDYAIKLSFGMLPKIPMEKASYECIKDYFDKKGNLLFNRGEIISCYENKTLGKERFLISDNFSIHFRPRLIPPHCILFADGLLSKQISAVDTNLFSKHVSPKTGDRIIYKVKDVTPKDNGYPLYGHAEIQEISDNGRYIKIYEKWRSLDDIEILDTVNNGKKGN